MGGWKGCQEIGTLMDAFDDKPAYSGELITRLLYMVSGNRVALKLVHDSIPSGRWRDVDSPRRGRIAGPAGFGQGSAGAPGWEWLVDQCSTASPASPATAAAATSIASSCAHGVIAGAAAVQLG
jgi:hypothetical protein